MDAVSRTDTGHWVGLMKEWDMKSRPEEEVVIGDLATGHFDKKRVDRPVRSEYG